MTYREHLHSHYSTHYPTLRRYVVELAVHFMRLDMLRIHIGFYITVSLALVESSDLFSSFEQGRL